MTMRCYYNEIDPFAAEWLKALIAAGHLPAGDVDTRSIADVLPGDTDGYDQCHFFAGIGGWPLALRIAGWPDDRPVWTGSCPCQPFSSAGKRRGKKDPRHLWPHLRRLVSERRPPVCFGEQVASKAGKIWLAGVRADLEALGYRVGAADLCAAGVGAPHIRQRLYWVADYVDGGREDGRREGDPGNARCGRGPQANTAVNATAEEHCSVGGLADACDAERGRRPAADGRSGILLHPSVGGPTNRLADTQGARYQGSQHAGAPGQKEGGGSRMLRAGGHVAPGRLGNAGGEGLSVFESDALLPAGREEEGRAACQPGLSLGWWSDFGVVYCRDDMLRRFEPGSFPLAPRIPGRVGRLRGYGNAINVPLAAEFIAAYAEATSQPINQLTRQP